MAEKLFVYDLETTGVRFWKNGVHQIAGAVVIDGVIKELIDFNVRPHKDALIEEEALAVSKVAREQVLAYPPMEEVHAKLVAILGKYVDKFNPRDKFHLLGYNNASFDNQFFRAFFTQCGDKYFGSWFWADTIDVMVLAANKLRSRRHEMENFKQGTVAKFLGIEVKEDELHNARYDTEILLSIFKIVS